MGESPYLYVSKIITMANKVFYEWAIETVDEYEDITDVSFWDELPKVKLAENERLCLVRNDGNEDHGLSFRLWAYVVDGKLPENFENENGYEVGYKVPKKYHAALK